MGAAFVAPGEALVDAIAVGLVGDDEDAAVGQRGRRGKQERRGKNADRNRMAAPRWEMGTADPIDAKTLIMINHGRARRRWLI